MSDYDQICIQNFLVNHINLQQFCFVLQNRLSQNFACNRLAGGNLGVDAKAMSLVQTAAQLGYLGELVYHLIFYWLKDIHAQPFVLKTKNMHKELEAFLKELQERGEHNRIKEVLELLKEIKPDYKLKETVPVVDGINYGPQNKKCLIFISYSHKDDKEMEALLTQLRVLENANIVDTWIDENIWAGDDWLSEIRKTIDSAHIAILFISANFLTSKFILEQEVPLLLERRRQQQNIRIVPVIAKPCPWKHVDWLSSMQIRPRNARPIWDNGGSHVDRDLADIANEIAQIVRNLECS